MNQYKRSTTKEDFERAWQFLQEHEFASKADIGRIIYGRASSGQHAITALETAGYLLSEDNRGRVYAFGRVS